MITTTILATPLPAFVANIRALKPTERSTAIRKLFKQIGISGLRVTTPYYFGICRIAIPEDDDHDEVHAAAEKTAHDEFPYLGMVHYCTVCKRRLDARNHLEKIVLAAFPDLDDRSNLETDYYDYVFAIDS